MPWEQVLLLFLIVEWFVFLHNSSITSLPLFLKSSVIRNASELNDEFSALLRFYGPSRLNFVEHIAVKALLIWLGLFPILLLGWKILLDWDHKWPDSYDHQIKGQLEEQGSNLFLLRLLQKSMKVLCMFINVCCTGFFNLFDHENLISKLVLLVDTYRLI